MTTLQTIADSIDLIATFNEIGNEDIKRLHALLPKLDNQFRLSGPEACELLFGDADKDAQLRAFQSRINSAVSALCQQLSTRLKISPNDATVHFQLQTLQQFEFGHFRKKGATPKKVFFNAALQITRQNPPLNLHYRHEDFVPLKSCGDQAPLKQTVFLSYTEKNSVLVDDFVEQLQRALKKYDLDHVEIVTQKTLKVSDSQQTMKAAMQVANGALLLLTSDCLKNQNLLEQEFSYLLKEKPMILVDLDFGHSGLKELREKIEQEKKRVEKKEKELKNAKSAEEKKSKEIEAKKAKEAKRNSCLQKLLDTELYELKDNSSLNIYSTCVTPEQKQQFVNGLARQVKRKFPTGLNPVDHENYMREIAVDARSKSSDFQDAPDISMDGGVKYALKPKSFYVVNDLLEWAQNANHPSPIYVVLGSFGMGKTFALREFTYELHDKTTNHGFYVDLRDSPTLTQTNAVDGSVSMSVPSLEQVISRALQLANRSYDADTVKNTIKQIQDGQVLLVADGLDERLTHMLPTQQRDYMKQLLRVFQPLNETESSEKIKSSARLVLSCRDHYFESLRQERQFFMDDLRGQTQAKDFRVVRLLPFDDEQMQELLGRVCTGEQAKLLWGLLLKNHQLKDIASRPWLLAKLPSLTKVLTQQSVNLSQFSSLASVYELLINDTLSRDEEKHILQRRHKLRLLVDLSHVLWKNKVQTIHIDDLNDWFHEWLDAKNYRQLYASRAPEVLEKDIRNSSLLVRVGDDKFSFGHSSMLEFFHAKWIYQALHDSAQDLAPLHSLSILPSQETLEFLFQLIQLKPQQNILTNMVHHILGHSYSAASKIALKLIGKQFLPTNTKFSCIDLRQANFEGWHFKAFCCERLLLDGCNLTKSQWWHIQANIVSLSQTNMDEVAWQFCEIKNIKWDDEKPPTAQYMTLVGDDYPKSLSQLTQQTGRHYNTSELHSDLLHVKPTLPIPSVLQGLQFRYASAVITIADSVVNNTIVLGTHDGMVKIWDAVSGQCHQTLAGHEGEVSAIAYDAVSQIIISGSADHSVKIWDVNSGQCRQTLQGHEGKVNAIAYDAASQTLISGSSDCRVKIWDINSGQCRQTLIGHKGGVRAIAYDATSQTLISGSIDHSVKIWDVNSGQCRQTLQGHEGKVNAIAYDATRQIIISGSNDRSVKIWDVVSGQCFKTLQGHKNQVNTIVYDSGSQTVVSGSHDHTVKVWDLVKGVCLKTLQGHKKWVNTVAYDVFNKIIISGSSDHTVKIWSANSEQCQFGQCQLTLRALPENESLVVDHQQQELRLSPLAWRYANFSDGQRTWALDAA